MIKVWAENGIYLWFLPSHPPSQPPSKPPGLLGTIRVCQGLPRAVLGRQRFGLMGRWTGEAIKSVASAKESQACVTVLCSMQNSPEF